MKDPVRHRDRYNIWHTLPDLEDYTDTPEFQHYAAMCEAIVHPSEVPVGTRQIHDVLGDKAKREWTLDALESLRSVEKIHGLIDRWRPVAGQAPVHRKKWTGKNMSWLFGRTTAPASDF